MIPVTHLIRKTIPGYVETDGRDTAGSNGQLPPGRYGSRPPNPQRRGSGQQDGSGQQGYPPGRVGRPNFPPRPQPNPAGRNQQPPPLATLVLARPGMSSNGIRRPELVSVATAATMTHECPISPFQMIMGPLARTVAWAI